MAQWFRSTFLAATIVLVGCGKSETADMPPAATVPAETKASTLAPPPSTQATAPAPTVNAAVLGVGKLAYAQCVTCHGSTGRGDGVMAGSLPIKPRSFAADEWRHVDFAKSATEVQASIERVLREGIPAAMMPGYASLPKEQMDALVLYVLELRRQGREGRGE